MKEAGRAFWLAPAVAGLAFAGLLAPCGAYAAEVQYATMDGLGIAQAVSAQAETSGSLLDGQEASETVKAVYRLLTAAVEAGQTEVKFDDMTVTTADLRDAMYMVSVNPEYFWVSFMNYRYSVVQGTDQVVAAYPQYVLDTKDIPALKAQVEAKVTEALSWVNTSEMSDFQMAQALHDYIVRTCVYDNDAAVSTEATTAHTVYGALVEGKAVCQGYVLAYKLLLSRVGISSVFVGSDTMGHAWNMVQMDGNWYHTDVTWDDPIYEGTGDGGFNSVSHTYFLRCDASFEKKYEHKGWAAAYTTPVVDYSNRDYAIYKGPYVAPASTTFDDVAEKEWYYPFVTDAASLGLMTGYGQGSKQGLFGPNDLLTRGQVATVLWRIAGEPEAQDGVSSLDVASGQYYSKAVAWCVDKGIITGFRQGQYAGKFMADLNVSREDFALMVYRFAYYMGLETSNVPTANFDRCSDVAKVSGYSTTAMKWCAAAEIITGKNVEEGGKQVKRLDPQANATRAQAAKIFVMTYRLIDGSTEPYEAMSFSDEEPLFDEVATYDEVSFDDVTYEQADAEAATQEVPTEGVVEDATQEVPTEATTQEVVLEVVPEEAAQEPQPEVGVVDYADDAQAGDDVTFADC